MSIECSKLMLLDYIKLHRGSDCCWDCSDTVFDAVITVDCSVDRDGKVDICDDEDTEYPHMPLFIREFLSKVEVKSLLSDGTPIIDVDGLLDRNMTLIVEWVRDNWSVESNWCWDDIKYQMIQEIHYAIAGYKGEKGYTAYYELFRQFFRTNEDASGTVHPGVKFNSDGKELD
mgnify:CR=1 FL=1